MNLYKISQNANTDWDTYDSAVVVAKNEAIARKIHPCGREYMNDWYKLKQLESSWCDRLDQVSVEYIGIASDDLKEGTVVCSSYNAGS